MKYIKFGLVVGLLYSATTFADINSVIIGQMTGDTSASEFSTIINFTPNNDLTSWQFGFYMPRPFISIKDKAFNPNLIMQICDTKNICSNLIYQQASSISSTDKSTGYTTLLAPANNDFPLKKDQVYTIKLLHNNQWNVVTYSSVPQNFFLAANNTTYDLASNKNTYQLLNYNQANVDAMISNHLATDWYNSATATPVSNPIIPAPVSYTPANGVFTLTTGMQVHNLLDSDNAVVTMLRQTLAKDTGISATIDNNVNANSGIIIQKVPAGWVNNNPEGYYLQITSKFIIIGALNDTGLFYALQTLRQLWNQTPKQLQIATITDYPRFSYRGILLDTTRHYFTVDEIKNLIDVMATQKLNTLHIHFADDEGFRLAIPNYPQLNTIGSTRGYGQNIGPMVFLQGNLDITNSSGALYPDASYLYKGYYSAQDIQDLISYANARKITIIPEIDIPGHARALVKALPDHFIDPNDHSVFASVQGYNDDVIPVCTYKSNISVGAKFTADINNIVNSVATLFNGQTTLYARTNEVSVGADEVSNYAWSNDASCQVDWLNLSALEKEHKFLQALAANNPNLLLSGWQQLVQNNDQSLGHNIVPANQTAHIYVWNTSNNGISQAINLAQNNYPTVLAFADQTYFDLAYTPAINEPGFSWGTAFSDTYAALSSALSANNTLNGIADPNQKANIVGIEGTLWSENLATYAHLIYMATPKMAGLAEASWSPASKTVNSNNQLDWQDLTIRLGCGQTGFLNFLNKNYSIQYRGYPNGIKQEVPAGTICS